jgi:hypothetical protein
VAIGPGSLGYGGMLSFMTPLLLTSIGMELLF